MTECGRSPGQSLLAGESRNGAAGVFDLLWKFAERLIPLGLFVPLKASFQPESILDEIP